MILRYCTLLTFQVWHWKQSLGREILISLSGNSSKPITLKALLKERDYPLWAPIKLVSYYSNDAFGMEIRWRAQTIILT